MVHKDTTNLIQTIKAELTINENDTGSALRNKMLKLQNLLGTINELLDTACAEYEKQKLIVEEVTAIAVEEIIKTNRYKKITSKLLDSAVLTVPVKYNNKTTSVTEEKSKLIELHNKARYIKQLHDQCTSAISVLRSALSFDKAELASL